MNGVEALREVREMVAKRTARNHSRSLAMRQKPVGYVLYGQTEDTYKAAEREDELLCSRLDAVIKKETRTVAEG